MSKDRKAKPFNITVKPSEDRTYGGNYFFARLEELIYQLIEEEAENKKEEDYALFDPRDGR